MLTDLYLSQASFAINLTAILFVLGLIYYTGSFRKRGLLSDRLFFALLVLDLAAAVGDAIADFAESSEVVFPFAVQLIAKVLYNFSLPAIWLLIPIYLLARKKGTEKLIRRLSPVLLLAPACSILAFAIEIYGPALPEGAYLTDPAFLLMEQAFSVLFAVVKLFCIVCGAVVLFTFSPRWMLLFLGVFLVREVMNVLFVWVYSSAFFFAALFTYMHVSEMDQSFEEVNG